MRVAPWKKVQDGYETTANGVKVTLSKKGRRWTVTIGDKTYEVKTKRPGFDHAEGIIQEHFKKHARQAMSDQAIAERVAARMLTAAKPPWPGYDRINGRLAGPSPAGFVVVKATRGSSGFGEDEVGSEYVGGKAHQGSILYLRKDGGGFKRWMDADGINQAVIRGVIKPYGVWRR